MSKFLCDSLTRLLMVILSHVCNFVSVKVFNKVLLTYLLTYLSLLCITMYKV